MIDLGNIDIVRSILLISGIAVAIGTVLGATEKIVVFRDVGDLMVTFSVVAGCALAAYVAVLLTADRPPWEQRLALGFFIAALCGMILFLARRAYADNKRVWAAALGLITKLPYAVFVPLLAVQVAAPRGKTASERANARASALLLLTIFAPLLVMLTRDKSAFVKLRRFGG